VSGLLGLPAAAGAATQWTPLSDAPTGDVNISNTNEIGLERSADGVLHVLWVNSRANGTQALLHSAVTGTVAGSPDVVANPNLVLSVTTAANQSFNDRVDLVPSAAGGLRALFATTFPGNTIDGILATSTSANGGSTWSGAVAASATASAQRSPVYAATGIGGATNLQGSTTGTWGDSSPTGGGYRVGLTTNGADTHFSDSCCEIDPNAAFDSATGAGFVAANLQDTGIQVIPLSGGASAVVPQSAHAWTLQRTSITGRIGADGVYVGYGTGDNMFNAKPAIWRIGAPQFIFLKNESDAGHVGIAAAPEGRLWVYWEREGSVYASRTNRDISKFGAIVKVKGPHSGDDSFFNLQGEGSLGTLDLFALASAASGPENWYVQRLAPGLTLDTPDGKVVKRGKKIKFQVTDAGDAVQGIDVSTVIGGKTISKTTNAAGKAKLKIPKDAKKGNQTAFTEPDPGYTGAKAAFKIKG
jgi:hypothetical protein